MHPCPPADNLADTWAQIPCIPPGICWYPKPMTFHICLTLLGINDLEIFPAFFKDKICMGLFGVLIFIWQWSAAATTLGYMTMNFLRVITKESDVAMKSVDFLFFKWVIPTKWMKSSKQNPTLDKIDSSKLLKDGKLHTNIRWDWEGRVGHLSLFLINLD